MLEATACPAGTQSSQCCGGLLDARGGTNTSVYSQHTHCISTMRATGSMRCCAVCAAPPSAVYLQASMNKTFMQCWNLCTGGCRPGSQRHMSLAMGGGQQMFISLPYMAW